LKKKFKYLKNKPVFIFGSSSAPNINQFSNEKIILSCNASARNLKNLNLPKPKITIIDNELIDINIINQKKSRSTVIDEKILLDLDLGDLISIQSNHSNFTNPKLLSANFSSFNFFSKNFRKTILNIISKSDLLDNNLNTVISTGIFAAYFCFLMEAKEVYLCGFSLHIDSKNKKWFYNVNGETQITNSDVRNHSLADSLAVALLVINEYKVISCEKDFLPLTKNWET
jgi:uncharacterized protein YjbI with pentapeptide repeats